MSLTSNKVTSFTFLHANQGDSPAASFASSAAFKTALDSQAAQLQTGLNGLIDTLMSIVLGSSGAENIGSAPITGVSGATIYAQLADLKLQLNGVATGSLPDNSITESKLAFAVATQAELDASQEYQCFMNVRGTRRLS